MALVLGLVPYLPTEKFYNDNNSFLSHHCKLPETTVHIPPMPKRLVLDQGGCLSAGSPMITQEVIADWFLSAALQGVHARKSRARSGCNP